MQAPLSFAYLRETAGDFADPQHAHSFARTGDAPSLSARTRLFLRDCALCHQRALALGHRPRDVCVCLRCGALAHRACLSRAHLQRGRESALPLCPTASASSLSSSSSSPSSAAALSRKKKSAPPRLFGNEHLPSAFTLSTLIEELAREPAGAPRRTRAKAAAASQPKSAAIARRAAPFLAAGGVLGALALGPIIGVVAGLNVLVAGVGVEALAAGVGLTAATAAVATVSHKQKTRRAKRKLERLASGAWAKEICWNCKTAAQGELSDAAFRKDAELLRRFQAADGSSSSGGDAGVPDADEVFGFLFSIFSSPSEFLSQVNVQLCAAFRERHSARLGARASGGGQSNKASPSSSSSLSASMASAAILRDTLHDAKMYVAHITGATMQSFPSLASTEQALAACAEAIERIVYDDIHAVVFREFEVAFADADVLFHESLDRIRKEQGDRPVSLLFTTGQGARPVLHEHLQVAEQKLATMVHRTFSPLRKLKLLCSAFRSICCFADQLHQTASNADILIPIVCSLLVASPQLLYDAKHAVWKRTFVSEIAFISFFTNGGGKGAEGYVLTTFQAVIQVIAAVDLSNGPAKELELFMEEADTEEDSEGEDDEFFDAIAEP